MSADDHGSASTYTNHGCRCETCTSAHSAACQRRQLVRQGEPVPDRIHGTDNAYTNYGCRCAECRRAHAATRRRAQDRARVNGERSAALGLVQP